MSKLENNLEYNLDDLFEGDLPESIELPELADTPSSVNQFTDGVSGGAIKDGELGGNLIGDKLSWTGSKLTITGELNIGTLFFNRQYVMTYFESLDGFTSLATGTGVNTVGLGSLYLRTGSTINSKAGISNDNLSIFPLDFQSKNSIFETVLAIPTLTGSNFDSYFAVGQILVGDNTDQGYGFRITNDVLYAFVEVDGVQTTSTITGITLGNANAYLVRNNASTNTVTFYVNGVLKATLTANYGVGASLIEERFLFYITNTVATSREMYVNHAIFAQDL